MRRILWCLVAVVVIAAFVSPNSANAQQSVNFWLGGFVPHDVDARENDVIVGNLDFLHFHPDDFTGFTFGGDWNVELNRWLDAALGTGFYQQTVHSVYRDYVQSDGTEVRQDLKLRIVPFTATINFLPLRRDSPIQPYIGGGVGVFAWRYSETGEFVSFPGLDVYHDSYVGSGAAAGPVVVGGVRAPIGASAVGFEIRYQSAEGDLPASGGFSAPKIDLGGFNYLATFGVRF